MKIISNFIEHAYTAIKYGEWFYGFKRWEGKPMFCISLMPYDGWHFCIHLWKFYVSVSYPWCGNID